jgi:hypothetical protein
VEFRITMDRIPWFTRTFCWWDDLGVALQQVQLRVARLDLSRCSGHRNHVDRLAVPYVINIRN